MSLGALAFIVPSVLAAIMEACGDVGGFSMTVSGRANLLDGEDDITNVRALTRLLHSDEQLESLILRLRSGKNILIGSDIGNETLSAHSFIAQPYTIEPSSGGFITAIVPMRCDYAYASAVLEYIAECVGRLFREMLMIE